MCQRTLERLRYHSRNASWINRTPEPLSLKRHAAQVDCGQFTTAVKGCRTVQLSPHLVNFYQGQDLVGQSVWHQSPEGDTELQFRLLAAH